MAKEMLINVSEGEECRIALMEDGKLEELYMERTSSTSHVGNIYKGRVTNVEPSIQAAFVDFGLGRNGFLHISDLMPSYFGRRGEDFSERVGQKMARKDRPPIQRCLRRGDDIVVQIIKEGIGTKGPTLSTYLSIPGRILVMMPGMDSMGVSRKIEDDEERRRLRQILDTLKTPDGVGFIIRTAGIGKTKAEIERDLKYLTRLWENLVKKRDSSPAPVELYTEGDLVTRTVRDLFSADVDQIVVDNKEVARRVKEVIRLSSPRTKNRVEVYEEPLPLFHKYGIEKDIELMYSRHVPLPSGGSLVIDSTEAIVAIDVNSGKFRDHSDAEMTAFKTDMEAAEEIPRQLRLRDLGGVIICDFIDLRYERHRRDLEKKLHDNFKRDRAKTKVLRMSQFGIIEMTRQRMRPSLKRSIYFDCPHCKGAGLVKTPESMSLDVMRRLAIGMNDLKVVRAELGVCPDVAFYLNNKKRRTLAELESQTGKRILIRSDPALGLDEMRLDLYDMRDGLVLIPELSDVLTSHAHTTQLGIRPQGHTSQNRAVTGAPAGKLDDRRRQTEQGRRGPQGQQRGGRGGRDRDREPEREREDALEDRFEPEAGDEPVERPDREPDQEQAPEAEQPQDRQRDQGRDRDRGRGGDRGRGRDDRGRQRDDGRPQRGQPQGRDRQPPPGPAAPETEADAEGVDEALEVGAEEGAVVGAEAGPTRGDNGAPREGGEEGEGGRRRRRRRRRRGRRGRGAQGEPGDQPLQAGPGEASGGEDDADAGPFGADEDGEPDADVADAGVAADAEARASEAEAEPAESPSAASASEDEEADLAPAAVELETDNEPSAEQQPGTEGGKRRRGRRGGRGRRRGKGGDKATADATADTSATAENGDTAAVEATGPADDAAAPERAADAATAPAAQQPTRPPARPSGRARIAAPEEAAPTARPSRRKPAKVDQHLVTDEEEPEVAPIALPTARRPGSYRDLDSIPDDFD